MATTSRARAFASDPNQQIRALRDQVDTLMRDRITPAVSNAADRAEDYAHQASDLAREKTEALSSQVKDRPIASVLVAAAVGYLIGRLTR